MTDRRGFVVWFTGDSPDGGAALAHLVAGDLERRGVRVQVLGPDRGGSGADAGQSPAQMAEQGAAVLVTGSAAPPAGDPGSQSAPSLQVVIGGAEAHAAAEHSINVPSSPEPAATAVLDQLDRMGLTTAVEEDVYSSEEEDEVAARLEALGYIE